MRLLNWLLPALAAIALSSPALAELLGPTPYSGTSDSPFSPAQFDYFHLETFDDHALNTPGVTATAGSVATSAGFSGSIIDQVGLSGGCPAGGASVACDTWFFSPASTGVQFVFNAMALGQLPDAAGLVWTDGGGAITFEAFDQNNVSLGIRTGNHADGSFQGTTGDDRFYGVTNAGGGISRIVIRNTVGGIEIDHLQYGFRQVPEPASLALIAVALAGLGLNRRTRKQ